MKKRRLAILLSGAAIIAMIGGTYAAFVASSDPIQKTVSAPTLGIDIQQTIGEVNPGEAVQTGDGISFQGGVPGAEVPDEVVIVNTEDQAAYVRVTIYRSWTEDMKKVSSEKLDAEEIEVIRENNDWLVVEPEDDKEVVYCYYKKPLEAGASSSPVMDKFTILKKSFEKNSNAYADKGVLLEFEADAVQTVAAQDAMLAEWGVVAEFSGDELVSVAEQ